MFPATTNPAAKIIGYHDDDALPVKRGDSVVIPKGTRITSMGKVREKTAGRATTVKVDHLLSGRSFNIGYVNKDGTRRPAQLSREDIELIEELYGANPEDLLDHANVAVRDERYLYLAIENPTIRWSGAGGYWHEVDINDVTIVSAT